MSIYLWKDNAVKSWIIIILFSLFSKSNPLLQLWGWPQVQQERWEGAKMPDSDLYKRLIWAFWDLPRPLTIPCSDQCLQSHFFHLRCTNGPSDSLCNAECWKGEVWQIQSLEGIMGGGSRDHGQSVQHVVHWVALWNRICFTRGHHTSCKRIFDLWQRRLRCTTSYRALQSSHLILKLKQLSWVASRGQNYTQPVSRR